MKIISHRRKVECSEAAHVFHWENMPSAGFSFDVDENGAIIVTPSCALNVTICLLGFDPDTGKRVVDDGIEVRTWEYVAPSVGECESCGDEVRLEHFTNTCECGADYNGSGQRLASRLFWGEETGESVSDILRIP